LAFLAVSAALLSLPLSRDGSAWQTVVAKLVARPIIIATGASLLVIEIMTVSFARAIALALPNLQR
jgi:hypothetical protein